MRRLLLSLLLATGCADSADLPDQRPLTLLELETSTPPDSPAEADYRRTCLPCHGADGKGNGGRTGADLTAEGGPLSRSDEELFASIRDGKRGPVGVMPPHRGLLSDEAIRGLVAYVRGRFGAHAATAASP